MISEEKREIVLCKPPQLKTLPNKTRVCLCHYCYTHSILKPLTQLHSEPFEWYQFVSIRHLDRVEWCRVKPWVAQVRSDAKTLTPSQGEQEDQIRYYS